MTIVFPEVAELIGEHVRLEPLSEDHLDGLAEVALEPSIWRYMSHDISTRDQLGVWIADAVAGRERREMAPFATFDRRTGDVVGSTRFGSLALEHRRAEIGWTFIAPAWQRTAINTEAKYLMLRYAFEQWGLQRVELKTHSQNARSRAAILRLGAREEGLFRKHMVLGDGSIRDTVYFSIIDDEWPAVKKSLEAKLGR
jgi:RimJ/RimL family protein N-acetyltransferase